MQLKRFTEVGGREVFVNVEQVLYLSGYTPQGLPARTLIFFAGERMLEVVGDSVDIAEELYPI